MTGYLIFGFLLLCLMSPIISVDRAARPTRLRPSHASATVAAVALFLLLVWTLAGART